MDGLTHTKQLLNLLCIVYDGTLLIHYCKFEKFREGFIFACAKFLKIKLSQKMAKKLCSVLIYATHAIVANFSVAKYMKR